MLEILDIPDATEIHKAGIYNRLLNSVLSLIFSEFPPHTHYLPAAPSGMTREYEVLAATLVRRSSDKWRVASPGW